MIFAAYMFLILKKNRTRPLSPKMVTTKMWSFLICSLVLASKLPGLKSDIVTIPDGQIRGTFFESEFSSYYGFLSIPYAKPPVGSLRFEPPQPPDPWDGILDATVEPYGCVSSTNAITFIAESEDCLYLNVYTPSLEPEEKLPVVFWIYGGGYYSGSSSKLVYGPDFLIAQNVIVVSFNYRLGPFGFLSTGDATIPGNNGLKDQNLALKWTKSNIEYFGGDPEKITIFGESAGAASVGLHILSEKSSGLFRAAIQCSGSSLDFWTVQEDPASLFDKFVSNIIGYTLSSTLIGVKSTLQAQSVSAIVSAQNAIPTTKSVFNFVPVIEVPNDDAFITASHYELLKNGSYEKVPLLAGIDAEEALVLLSISTANIIYYAGLYDLIPSAIIPTNLNVTGSNQTAAISAIRNLYLDEDATFLGNLTAVVKYFGDNVIVRPTLKQAEIQSESVPVYLYEFNYYGGRRYLPVLYVPDTGNVSHTGELPYLFYCPLFYTSAAEDILVQNRMVTMWTNFVKYLNPTPNQSDLFNNTIWQQYNTSSSAYLYIDTDLELKSGLRSSMLSSWDNIFETYGEEPFVTY